MKTPTDDHREAVTAREKAIAEFFQELTKTLKVCLPFIGEVVKEAVAEIKQRSDRRSH